MLGLNRVLIDTYCGQRSNFTIFSTHNLFELEFEMADSLSNEEYSEYEKKILFRKGFKLHYKFSKFYADLSFITGKHVTGTSKHILIIYLLIFFKIKNNIQIIFKIVTNCWQAKSKQALVMGQIFFEPHQSMSHADTYLRVWTTTTTLNQSGLTSLNPIWNQLPQKTCKFLSAYFRWMIK